MATITNLTGLNKSTIATLTIAITEDGVSYDIIGILHRHTLLGALFHVMTDVAKRGGEVSDEYDR